MSHPKTETAPVIPVLAHQAGTVDGNHSDQTASSDSTVPRESGYPVVGAADVVQGAILRGVPASTVLAEIQTVHEFGVPENHGAIRCAPTLAGTLVRAQVRGGGEVLGMPVKGAGGRVLYLAMDRPRQIARAMARQFTEADRSVLAERLVVRPGPPPKDLARHPETLLAMAIEHDAAIVYVDSLKDAAIGLSEDEVGAGYNRARQALLADGRQVCELHHTVKRGPNGQAPATVADIYGSTWLTAGAGSVILLGGEPGDPIVSFRHVKQPAAEVGPWRLLHDQHLGAMTIEHNVDLVTLAANMHQDGLTARAAAIAICEKAKPSRTEIEKARRRLDSLVRAGQLQCVEGAKGGAQSAYFAA